MNEIELMDRAYELAAKGEGFTSPNPCVGAVIADKNGKIYGEGYHEKASCEHAEVNAYNSFLFNYSDKINQEFLDSLTFFITLEPCCHTGKTPPCTDLLIKSGIKNYIVGMLDPNPEVSGKGVKILESNGFQVKVLDDGISVVNKLRLLNQPFLKSFVSDFPYLTIKAGMSLDGAVASAYDESKWITSEDSRFDAKLERSKYDAVMIGSNTLVRDNPHLGAISPEKKLLRVVVTQNFKFDFNFDFFRDESFLVITNEDSLKRLDIPGKFLKNVIGLKEFTIENVLLFLRKYGVQSVFVEGGSKLQTSIFDAFLNNREILDKVLFYYSPIILGGKDKNSIIGGIGSHLSSAPKFVNSSFNSLENDFKFEGFYRFY